MNNHSEISALRLDVRRQEYGYFGDWRLALKSILGFWLFYALTVVSRAFLGSDPWTVLENKTVTIVSGIVFTAAIYAGIRLFALRATIGRRAVVATIGSFIAAGAMAGVLIWADRYQEKPQDEERYVSREGYRVIELGNTMRLERDGQAPLTVTWPHISALNPYLQFRIAADSAVIWLFFFAAWSAFYIAMLAQAEALGARRRAAEAESAARSAQVRALRYQVNPHFLFNTLNSLSSLVMSGRPAEAESMILKLSTFFRTSLSLDASADVTLAEEIALQSLYLDIERVRFPKRLKVEIDVPPNLETARLPALVLQPVVENAIKYGVSPTREKVILKISAREAGPGRFTLEVSNTGKHSQRRNDTPEGTGVGLGNVCERLRARFGNAVQCEFGPIDEGGYRVVMTLPLDRTDG
ncbi:histidine kinase [Sphingomonas sp.]|uniref:sensor histidine kinase n=1 Tax=Sphingomonas sp. TaxID=28214 RepID=UPI00286AFF59|nr:histidine kinase [Sphingomonas sp.]